MQLTRDTKHLLKEATEKIQRLQDSLPSLVDPASISLTAKIPYKALSYREALIWRTEDIASSALNLYEHKKILAAIILTRAIAENASAVWYLMTIIQKSNTNGVTSALDERITQLLLGSRNIDEMPDSINVMTMIQKADKKIPGILKNYEELCEYAHPNWAGTSSLYSQIDPKKIRTHLGKDPQKQDKILQLGLYNLVSGLSMFEFSYNEISDLMPKFIKHCENDIKTK